MTPRNDLFCSDSARESSRLYQSFGMEESCARIARHYDFPSEFFTLVTGGKWHTYSSNLFNNTSSLSSAQEIKFHKYAQLLKLASGDNVLDIGSGWGGPLTFLTKHYGICGLGITVSSAQQHYSIRRVRQHSLEDVITFEQKHWIEMSSADLQYDAIYSDEMIAHEPHLDKLYERMFALLKPGGRVVNKELHLTSTQYEDWSGPIGRLVNGIFGNTGNYRVLDQEIDYATRAGFKIERIEDIAITNYVKTVDCWLANLNKNKFFLLTLISHHLTALGIDNVRPGEYLNRFHTYLRATKKCFRENVFNQQFLVFLKPDL